MTATSPSAITQFGTSSEGNFHLTFEELEELISTSQLVEGVFYYTTDTGQLWYATSNNEVTEVTSTAQAGTRFLIEEDEIIRNPAKNQYVIGMDLTIDGFLLNDGYIVEVD